MKFLTLLFLTLSSVQAFADCPLSLKKENLCARIEWTKGPQAGVPSAFNLVLWNAQDGSATDPKNTLFVKTWMIMANGHDHGGPKVNLVKKQKGLYQVNDLKLFGGMKGSWLLIVQLLDGETVIDEAKYEVPLKD